MMDKNTLIKAIIEEIKNENLMWFIVEEVEDSLDYLNKYKLKNIYDNLSNFIEELKQLNQNYIKSL